MVTFVSYSQSYLSEYLVQNSKDHVGERLDPNKLAELIGMPEFASQPEPSVLVLWSVTCAPCLEKLKSFKDLTGSPSFANRRWIPINTDQESALPGALKVLAEYLPNQAFYHDRNKTLVTQLEVDYLPANIYLSAEGVIEKISVGDK